MNNILFFLTPKAMCAYLYDDYTIRQALEKMEGAGYAALPILNRRGEYRGTLTEGDLLWAMKNLCYMDMRQAEARRQHDGLRKQRRHTPDQNTGQHAETDPLEPHQQLIWQRLPVRYVICSHNSPPFSADHGV